MLLRGPDKPPTPSEYAVIAWVGAILFLGFGGVALVVAFRAPPGRHELAVALAHLGLWSLGIGAGIAFFYWLVRRL